MAINEWFLSLSHASGICLGNDDDNSEKRYMMEWREEIESERDRIHLLFYPYLIKL